MSRISILAAVLALTFAAAPLPSRAAKTPPPGSSADLANRAAEALRQNNVDEGLRLANLAVQANPNNPSAYAVRGHAYNMKKLYEQAESDASLALSLKPDQLHALNVRARARLELGKYADAEADARQALALFPKNGHAWLALGQLRELEGNLAEANKDFQKAARNDKTLRPDYDAFLQRNAEQLKRLGLGDSRITPAALGAAGALLLLGASVGFFLKGRKRAGPKLRVRKFGEPGAPGAETEPQSGLVTLPAGGGPAANGGEAAATGALTLPAGSGDSDRAYLLAHNYEIKRELGRGGMGVVYEAFDSSLGRKVAIKEMRSDVAQSARDRERFVAEARTVAKFQHPNIVSIYSILEDGPRVFLVFEHVDGESLDKILKRHRRLGPQVVVPLIKSIGDALDYSHSRKVIHRDLKPANIMITEEDVVKVMDFGIAHEAKQALAGVTNAEAFGTMAYMPPEQELGQASKESDVFAFAVLAYETILGRLPFPGPNFIAQKQQKAFERPSKVDHGLPPALDALFEKALDPDLKLRPSTAGEFAQAVEAAFASRGSGV